MMMSNVETLFGLAKRPEVFNAGLEDYLLTTDPSRLSEEELELADLCRMKVGKITEECDITDVDLAEGLEYDKASVESLFIALEFMERYSLEEGEAGAPAVGSPATGSTTPSTTGEPQQGNKPEDTGKKRGIAERIGNFFKMIWEAIKKFVGWIVGFVKKVIGWIADRMKSTDTKLQEAQQKINLVDQNKVVGKKVRELRGDPTTPLKEFNDKIKNAEKSVREIEQKARTNCDPKKLLEGKKSGEGGNSAAAEQLLAEVKSTSDAITSQIDKAQLTEAMYNGVTDISLYQYPIKFAQFQQYIGSSGSLAQFAQETAKGADAVGKNANIFGKEIGRIASTLGNFILKNTTDAEATKDLTKTGQLYRLISQLYTKLGAAYSAEATEIGNIIGDMDKLLNAILAEARVVEQQKQQQAQQQQQQQNQQQGQNNQQQLQAPNQAPPQSAQGTPPAAA